ncbi:hypothetical protein FACS1894188_10340 [Clostridia bacterium]|nr:hypothetical protein FACS1894188_10340 [Clostridia bacterium]
MIESFVLQENGLNLYVCATCMLACGNGKDIELIRLMTEKGCLIFPTYLDVRSEETVRNVADMDGFGDLLGHLRCTRMSRVAVTRRIFEELKGCLGSEKGV